MLSESKGNILDDHVLIETLHSAKITSIAIKERQIESLKTKQSIEEARLNYRPVAVRGTILYFVIADLAAIDPMYQYSLKFFKSMFEYCLRNAPSMETLQES